MDKNPKLDLNIGFIGMSHLGQNSCMAAIEKVKKVVCFDQDEKLISNLKNQITEINEPYLSELLKANSNDIIFTHSLEDLKKCDIIYLSKDVPTNENAESDLDVIYDLIEELCKYLPRDKILVILCQVPPGFTRKVGNHFCNLYYQVETLIFGKAIERARFPERIIIGCKQENRFISDKLKLFLNAFRCPIFPMSYESAELTKTAINIVLAAQVSVANSLSEICELSKGDWHDVIPALKLDKRIGKFAYLDPGLGISGGNIERDIKTLSKLSKELKGNDVFLNSISSLSKYRKNWSYDVFIKNTKPKEIKSIGIVGLAYKTNTESIKNSPSIDLLKHLDIPKINVYDPLVKKIGFKKEINFHFHLLDAIKEVDVLFIMLPYEELKKLTWENINNLMKGNLVVDPFRTLSLDHPKGMTHVVLGKN